MYVVLLACVWCCLYACGFVYMYVVLFTFPMWCCLHSQCGVVYMHVVLASGVYLSCAQTMLAVTVDVQRLYNNFKNSEQIGKFYRK